MSIMSLWDITVCLCVFVMAKDSNTTIAMNRSQRCYKVRSQSEAHIREVANSKCDVLQIRTKYGTVVTKFIQNWSRFKQNPKLRLSVSPSTEYFVLLLDVFGERGIVHFSPFILFYVYMLVSLNFYFFKTTNTADITRVGLSKL